MVGGADDLLGVVRGDAAHVPEVAALDEGAQHGGLRQVARPHGLHDQHARAPGGVGEGAGLRGGDGDRLLDEHVLARGDRGEGDLGVAAVRGRHVDDVHLRVGDEGVDGAHGLVRAVLGREGSGPVDGAGADGDEALGGVRLQRPRELARDPAGADDAPAQRGLPAAGQVEGGVGQGGEHEGLRGRVVGGAGPP